MAESCNRQQKSAAIIRAMRNENNSVLALMGSPPGNLDELLCNGLIMAHKIPSPGPAMLRIYRDNDNTIGMFGVANAAFGRKVRGWSGKVKVIRIYRVMQAHTRISHLS
eukprot:3247619-Amphidinium_carterae.4